MSIFDAYAAYYDLFYRDKDYAGEAAYVDGLIRRHHPSSQSVLDQAGHKEGTPVTENSNLEPYPERRGLYTQTKLAAERIVLDAVRDRGLKAAIVRPGQIFGPEGQKPLASTGVAQATGVTGLGAGPGSYEGTARVVRVAEA